MRVVRNARCQIKIKLWVHLGCVRSLDLFLGLQKCLHPFLLTTATFCWWRNLKECLMGPHKCKYSFQKTNSGISVYLHYAIESPALNSYITSKYLWPSLIYIYMIYKENTHISNNCNIWSTMRKCVEDSVSDMHNFDFVGLVYKSIFSLIHSLSKYKDNKRNFLIVHVPLITE